jgi:hypothetical protein
MVLNLVGALDCGDLLLVLLTESADPSVAFLLHLEMANIADR